MRIKVRVRRGEGPIEEKDGLIIVYTNEKREKNEANLDVVRKIAKFYSVPTTGIRIVSGASLTRKVVEIKKD